MSIYKSFERLKEVKRMRILDAAFKEFAEKGYELSSTNTIVENARIGKGMLFYYFHSKEKLFNYLVDYGLGYIRNHLVEKIDTQERDYLKKIDGIVKLKLEIYEERPNIFAFSARFSYDDQSPAYGEIRKTQQQLSKDIYEKLYKNVEYGYFRDDIDHHQMIRLINLTLEGLEEELLSKMRTTESFDMEEYSAQTEEVIHILKKVYYKEIYTKSDNPRQ